MPPNPQWWIGGEAIVASWVEDGFGNPSWGELKCVPTRANRQPAVAVYHRRPGESAYRPLMLDVLRVEENGVAEVVAFPLEPLVDALGLPKTI
jgi:RNA polymerase sigma-70 factor, ECF subfamily